MLTLEIVSQLLVAGVSAAAAGLGALSTWRAIRKSDNAPLTVRRKGSDKAVTLPAHYSEQAGRALLDLVA